MTARKTVLLVSLFHPELVRGGAQQVCHELFEGLKGRDDLRPVLLASVEAGGYPALFKSGACITGFDGRADEYLFLSSDYDYWWHKCSNPRLIEAYAEFLEQIRPDVVHFHHFLLYGIDLLSVTRRVLPKARIVFTLHEFLLMCAADGHMLRRSDRTLCTNESQVRCHQCFPDRAPEEFFMRKRWLQHHLEVVDAFTCPTRFMVQRYVDWGLDARRVSHVSNGQRNYAGTGLSEPARKGARNRFGFFGQMVDVKGVLLLLEAVDLLRNEGFADFRVEINGGNLQFASAAAREAITKFQEAELARPTGQRNVFFNGPYDVDQLPHRMAGVDWVVMPSLWWEAFGLVISEAWMFGRPVICSNIGAMAERVRDGVDGLHFQVGSATALAATLRRACEERSLWKQLRGGIKAPPAREEMVNGFLKTYGLAQAKPAIARSARR